MSGFKQLSKADIEICNYLRSNDSGLKPREAIVGERRVRYFKGESAVKSLQLRSHKFLKFQSGGERRYENAEKAKSRLEELLELGMIQRAKRLRLTAEQEKLAKGKVVRLQFVDAHTFDEGDCYVWVYQGSMFRSYLVGTAIIVLTLAAVMFPLWPWQLRLVVWYLSMGLLGLILALMVLAIVRLILYVFLLVATGRKGWIFPNLFADVGIIESFLPAWEWEAVASATSNAQDIKEEVSLDASTDNLASLADDSDVKGFKED